MKKLLFLFFIPLLFVSCGDDAAKEDGEVVELKTEKDRLSYVLGAMNAKTIVGTPDPNIARLDMELVAKGFSENLSESNPDGCDVTLKKLFGPNFQDFNEAYAKEGAECLGRLTGYTFYRDLVKMNGKDHIDMKMAVIGFRHGLLKKDTLISDREKQEIVQKFIGDLTKESGEKVIAEAKKHPGAQVFGNDIVIEVIKDGKGGSPSSTDDVKIEYILMNAMGDTMQSSYEMKKMTGSTESVALQLKGGVIPGWTFALPKMKKGGKYKLYVPWKLAYGAEGMYNPQTQRMDIQPYETLVFIIDLVDYAPNGVFVKPQAVMPQGQGF